MNEKQSRAEFLKKTAMASAALLVSSLEGWAATTPDKPGRRGCAAGPGARRAAAAGGAGPPRLPVGQVGGRGACSARA